MLKPMATILIVEDDALLLDALSGQLKQLNYSVCTATSVAQGTAFLQEQAVDGIILDLGLPDADGLDLLTWARTHIEGLPVLILTARDGVDDRVRGLNAGADDYLTKPFNMQELQARLQAMLRRARQPAFTQASNAQGGPSTTIGSLHLDHNSRMAALDGVALELTQREWELLELLVHRCGRRSCCRLGSGGVGCRLRRGARRCRRRCRVALGDVAGLLAQRLATTHAPGIRIGMRKRKHRHQHHRPQFHHDFSVSVNPLKANCLALDSNMQGHAAGR